jgi:hypothetical protein
MLMCSIADVDGAYILGCWHQGQFKPISTPNCLLLMEVE